MSKSLTIDCLVDNEIVNTKKKNDYVYDYTHTQLCSQPALQNGFVTGGKTGKKNKKSNSLLVDSLTKAESYEYPW